MKQRGLHITSCLFRMLHIDEKEIMFATGRGTCSVIQLVIRVALILHKSMHVQNQVHAAELSYMF